MVVVEKEYKLVCSPNSDAVEAEVNKLIQKNPGAKITFQQAISGVYCDRNVQMDCIKCASRVVPAAGQYQCVSCKRLYTKDEFEQHSHTVFSIKGTHYLQPLIIERGGPDAPASQG